MLYRELSPAAVPTRALRGPAGIALTLANLPVGAAATVIAVELWDSLGDRLVELGLTPGAPIAVLRRGLFGGPVQVRIRDFALSLNRVQAQAVRVQLEAVGG